MPQDELSELDLLIDRQLATDALATHLTAVEQAKAAVLATAEDWARGDWQNTGMTSHRLWQAVREWMELRKS